MPCDASQLLVDEGEDLVDRRDVVAFDLGGRHLDAELLLQPEQQLDETHGVDQAGLEQIQVGIGQYLVGVADLGDQGGDLLFNFRHTHTFP